MDTFEFNHTSFSISLQANVYQNYIDIIAFIDLR